MSWRAWTYIGGRIMAAALTALSLVAYYTGASIAGATTHELKVTGASGAIVFVLITAWREADLYFQGRPTVEMVGPKYPMRTIHFAESDANGSSITPLD